MSQLSFGSDPISKYGTEPFTDDMVSKLCVTFQVRRILLADVHQVLIKVKRALLAYVLYALFNLI